ncbi:MAG: outer membrane beta-barrel protein [Tannerella sp.]|jgi:hypothetical protein|nr:outer membrane beta-barrel protein [Tannerella sp.]
MRTRLICLFCFTVAAITLLLSHAGAAGPVITPFLAYSDTAANPVVIRGRIVDKDKQPLPHASVYISSPNNPAAVVKGVISDGKGEFVLPSEKNKSFIFNVSFMGYKNHSARIKTDSEEIDMGDILLEESPYELDELTVKPPLTVTADKIIYNFENDPDRATSSIYDMIGKMPMVYINPRGKVVVGSEEKKYTVLRKGREDALFNFQNVSFEDLIKKLPAMGFTTFEIWTVMPPKYSQYDYVINILPDPNARLFGAVGTPEAGYSFDRGELRTGLGSNGSADIFRFAGGVKYANSDAPERTSETNTTFYATGSDPESYYRQKGTNYDRGDAWTANLSASLDISKREFITFKFNSSFSDSENVRRTTTDKTAGDNTLFSSISKNTSKYKADSWSLGATYELGFRKESRTFNVSYLYGASPSLRRYHRALDYLVGGADESIVSTDDVMNNTHRFQLDYYDQFLGDKLKFNAQAGYLLMDYSGEGIVLNELTGMEEINRYTRLQQDFRRIDGLVNFSYNASRRLNISANMATDYLPWNINATKSTTGTFIEDIRQEEFLFNGRGGFSYRFSIPERKKKGEKSYNEMTQDEKIAYIQKMVGAGINVNDLMNNGSSAAVPNSSIRFEYAYRQRRPGVSQLTNYSDEQNPLYIRRGNPNLNPELNHSLYAIFNSWFINSAVASFSFSDDKIVSQSRKEGAKIVQSYYNSGRTRDFSVGLSHPFFKRKVTLGSLFSSSYIDYGDGNWREQNRWSVSTKYNLNISKTCNAGLSLNYEKFFNSGAESEKDVFPFILSMETLWSPKIFGRQVLVTVGLNDILQWDKRRRRDIYMPDYMQSEESRYHRIPISFSLRTTLGKFKVKPVKTSKSNASVSGFSTDEQTQQ